MKTKVILVARLLLIFGGLNYLSIALTNTNYINSRFLVVLIGLSTLFFVIDRNFYLPFLGPCVFPIKETTNQITTNQIVDAQKVSLSGLPPKANVVYWAATTNTNANPFSDYKDAYGNFENSGVSVSDETGNAVIEIACPGQYQVNKFGIKNETLPKHVHYRYELPGTKGLFSEVKTKDLNC